MNDFPRRVKSGKQQEKWNEKNCIRKDIEKGRFKDVNIREVAKMINSYDINILGNYIFGLPEDSIKTMNETLDLALDLNTEHANFYPAQALPGSPLYFEAKKRRREWR